MIDNLEIDMGDAEVGVTARCVPNLRADYMTPQEATQATGLSRNTVYRHLPRVKVGRKVLIPVEAVRRLLAGEVRDVA